MLNIEFDGEKPKVSLGIKQLVPDPWDRIPYDYPVGSIVDAKVIKVLDFGAFVEIEKGVEGLIHVSEFSDERVEDPQELRQARPGPQGRDHQRRHGRAEDRPVVPGRRARRGSGRRAGLHGRGAHRHPGRRHAREAGGPDPAAQDRVALRGNHLRLAGEVGARPSPPAESAGRPIGDADGGGPGRGRPVLRLVPPAREAVGLRAVLRLRRLLLPRRRAAVRLRHAGDLHPGAAGGPDGPPARRRPAVARGAWR